MSISVFRLLIHRASFNARTEDERSAMWLLWKRTLADMPERRERRSPLLAIASAMAASMGVRR